jgi:squalene synthase HpnC
VIENKEIESAYADAINFTKSHYENFPVLSFLVPRKLYKHVAIIYKFARQADDIADEGEISADARIKLLSDFEMNFHKSINEEFTNSFWMALAHTIKTKNLTPNNFSNLLIAFRQDITITRYATFNDLLNYCANSANPVGRIILELHNIRSEEANEYSDKICTALQLTNFLQDVTNDFDKGRIYLPTNELAEYLIDENIFHLKKINSNFQQLIKVQVERVATYFDEGKNLLPLLPFRLKQQIKWTINGGEEILNKIVNLNYNVLNYRPKFSKLDLIKLLFNMNVR